MSCYRWGYLVVCEILSSLHLLRLYMYPSEYNINTNKDFFQNIDIIIELN